MNRKLVVTLTLSAAYENGQRFSEGVQRSFGMERAEFHALQGALSEMLLALGTGSIEAKGGESDDPAPEDYPSPV